MRIVKNSTDKLQLPSAEIIFGSSSSGLSMLCNMFNASTKRLVGNTCLVVHTDDTEFLQEKPMLHTDTQFLQEKPM
ncbi:unnamed protein product [Amoebophrya sp. A25]|nr:unnamed protein product [Amoebophrya sp. A25]|eukprot:GSA25T00027740001.1